MGSEVMPCIIQRGLLSDIFSPRSQTLVRIPCEDCGAATKHKVLRLQQIIRESEWSASAQDDSLERDHNDRVGEGDHSMVWPGFISRTSTPRTSLLKSLGRPVSIGNVAKCMGITVFGFSRSQA